MDSKDTTSQTSLAQIQGLLDTIRASNEDAKVIAGLDILNKLIANILKNPTEDKFRVLKKSNKAIQSKLLALKPDGAVIQLIEALGYTYLDDEIHAFAGDYFQTLMEGSNLIQSVTNQLRMDNMSEDERKKHELIRKNQEEYKAKMKADAAYKKQLEDLSHKDRKVAQAVKNTDQRGNTLAFGSTLVQFEPPASGKGG